MTPTQKAGDYRIGDEVRVVGTVAGHPHGPQGFRLRVRHFDDTEAVYHTDYVELVKRGKRELNPGDRIVAKCNDLVFIWTGTSDNAGWLCVKSHEYWRSSRIYPRDELSFDVDPDGWDFYPTPAEPEADQ